MVILGPKHILNHSRNIRFDLLRSGKSIQYILPFSAMGSNKKFFFAPTNFTGSDQNVKKNYCTSIPINGFFF